MNSYETFIASGEELTKHNASYEERVEAAWKAATEAVKLFAQCGYTCVVRTELPDVIVVEYQFSDKEFGADRPMWITQEEEENILDCRYQDDGDMVEIRRDE